MEILDVILQGVNSASFIVTNEHRRALDNMQSCHTYIRGGKVLRCPHCNSTTVYYNPCNQRGCPVCYRKNQLLWKDKLQKRLLPISHYHLVFSVPEIFTTIWLRNKKEVANLLFSAISAAIKKLGEEHDVLFGSVLAFQSHGRGLCYKPHIHCVLTAGGTTKTQNWVDIGSINYTQLSETFRCSIHEKLKELELDLSEKQLHMINDSNKGFSVYPTFHHLTGKQIVEYLSHSISGVVIDMDQVFQINKELGTITFSEVHNEQLIKTTVSIQTFIERYLNHIPPAGLVTVRYYGLYSNRNKETVKILRNEFVDQSNNIRIEEYVPINICPNCQAQMEVILVFLPREYPDLTKYGYIHGPPDHGCTIKSA